jgi:Ni,Fe-hydrogenase III small subunit
MFVLLRDLRRLRRQVALDRTRRAGHSLALRHVDAGSCNGCEHELNAVTSPFYDLSQHGLSIVASPRHADVLLVTGPMTTRMVRAARAAYESMPEPRLVAALGDCALGCGTFTESTHVVGSIEQILPVAIRIPGCPPSPQRIAQGLLDAIDSGVMSNRHDPNPGAAQA